MGGPILYEVRPAKDWPVKLVNTRIRARISRLMAAADKKIDKAQASYKQYHDRKVPVPPHVKPGKFVFVDRAPSTTKKTSEKTRINLLPRAVGPFNAIAAPPETVIIKEYGLMNLFLSTVLRSLPKVE